MTVPKEAVKIEDIPDTAEVKWDKNSDYWLEGIPKGQQYPLSLINHCGNISVQVQMCKS